MNTPVVSPSVQDGGSSPAGLRAGGLFFGWVMRRVHDASLLFLSKKSITNGCELFASGRAAIKGEAWKA